MRAIRTMLICGVTLISTGKAMAEPFCVQLQGIPLQCLYVDPTECQREASRQGGACAANPAEFQTPTSGSQFCVVRAGGILSCVYPDRASCDADGKRLDGACIAATPAPNPARAPDPYVLVRPY